MMLQDERGVCIITVDSWRGGRLMSFCLRLWDREAVQLVDTALCCCNKDTERQFRMSDENKSAAALRAVTSHNQDDPAASLYDGEGNPLVQLLSQILK